MKENLLVFCSFLLFCPGLLDMKDRQSITLLKFLILAACLSFSIGSHQHRVGDSAWSIPPNKDFYCNWSSNHFFKIGDNLVFEFHSEFHNVMQVTRRDYDTCKGENPLQFFVHGPATVPLVRHGMVYFICNFSNYCLLGQKVSVAVHRDFPRPVRRPVPSSPRSVPPPAPSQADTEPHIHVNASRNETGITQRSDGNVSLFLEWRRWILILLVALLYLPY